MDRRLGKCYVIARLCRARVLDIVSLESGLTIVLMIPDDVCTKSTTNLMVGSAPNALHQTRWCARTWRCDSTGSQQHVMSSCIAWPSLQRLLDVGIGAHPGPLTAGGSHAESGHVPASKRCPHTRMSYRRSRISCVLTRTRKETGVPARVVRITHATYVAY